MDGSLEEIIQQKVRQVWILVKSLFDVTKEGTERTSSQTTENSFFMEVWYCNMYM